MRSGIAVFFVVVVCVMAITYAVTAEDATKQTDVVARGEYLVRIAGCDDCHTPKKMGPNGPELDMERRLSGQPQDEPVKPVMTGALQPDGWMAMTNSHLTAWAGPWGISYAINLTPDKTGMAEWTEGAFIRAMRTGKHRGFGRAILPPMPWQSLAAMTDNDLKAVFAYLQTLKPVANTVPEPIPPSGN
jgi:mono/diheme cytochrome c family protein